MIREEIVHINGIPKKLIIFLHGYLDDADTVNLRLKKMIDTMPDCAIHIPQAPFLCEVDNHMRQWYSMYRFDPKYERKNTPKMSDFVEYYNKMSLGLAETHSYLEPYIEQTLAEYDLQASDLYLCGFSQGAMSAIYTALMFPEKIGGLLSFSGIIAGFEYLQKNAKNHPSTLLLHGTEDNLLRHASMKFTADKLKRIGCSVKCISIKDAKHQITSEFIEHGVKFITGQISK
ncbi:MAG: hypothetical protein E7019_06935 [Alphaproteobacteria bacterium]|nr:hypothetical protein [Alphaproteobacteria bacterium]